MSFDPYSQSSFKELLTVEKYLMIGGQLTSPRFSKKVTDLKPVIIVPCHSPILLSDTRAYYNQQHPKTLR